MPPTTPAIQTSPAPQQNRPRNVAVLVTVLVIAALAVAVAGYLIVRQVQNSADTATEATQVVIDGDHFTPSTVQIKAGDQITWVNEDNKQRGIIADQQEVNGLTTGEPLRSGDTFTYTFEKPGTYTYRDSAFPDTVKGVVIVE